MTNLHNNEAVKDSSRRLGYWETLNALVHEIHGHGTIATITKVSQRIDPQALQRAMLGLFTKHPLLRGTLSRDVQKFYRVNLNAHFEDIEFTVATIHTEQEAEKIYQEHLFKPFDITKSLWRITLVLSNKENYCYLICSFCHAIGDGLSAANAVKEILEFLNQIKIGEFALPLGLPFAPPVEAMLDKAKFLAESKTILSQGEVTLTADKKSSWPFQTKDPGLATRRTGNIFAEINTPLYQQLAKTCDQHNVSIHDALNAALLVSLQQLLSKNLTTNLCTPINLRNFCQPNIPPDYFGCYVTMILTHHEVTENTDFWLVAKNYREKVGANILQGGNYPEQYNLSDISPYAEQCISARKEFFMDFGVSNLGRLKDFDLLQNNYYKPEFFYVCASRQAADFAGLLCAASFLDKIFINFSYTQPLMHDNFMLRLKDMFIENIQTASKS